MHLYLLNERVRVREKGLFRIDGLRLSVVYLVLFISFAQEKLFPTSYGEIEQRKIWFKMRCAAKFYLHMQDGRQNHL